MKIVYIVISKLKYGNRDSEIDSAYESKEDAKAYVDEWNEKESMRKYKIQKVKINAPIAQSGIERHATNVGVGGSNPSGST